MNKKIACDGFIYVLKYEEISPHYGDNESLYAFKDLKTARSYMKKQIKDTILRLCDIEKKTEKDYETKFLSKNCCVLNCIGDDEIHYEFTIIKLPMRLNDVFENPDKKVSFVDVNKKEFSFVTGITDGSGDDFYKGE